MHRHGAPEHVYMYVYMCTCVHVHMYMYVAVSEEMHASPWRTWMPITGVRAARAARRPELSRAERSVVRKDRRGESSRWVSWEFHLPY